MAVTHLPAGNAAQDRRELLRAALGRMRHVTGLPVTFGGEVPAGGRGVHLTEFAGTRTDVLSGLVINAGTGLGGRGLVAARPASVDDYAADSRISHEYDKPVTIEGLRAIGAVPVVVSESVVGVLYGGTREPLPLGGRGAGRHEPGRDAPGCRADRAGGGRAASGGADHQDHSRGCQELPEQRHAQTRHAQPDRDSRRGQAGGVPAMAARGRDRTGGPVAMFYNITLRTGSKPPSCSCWRRTSTRRPSTT